MYTFVQILSASIKIIDFIFNTKAALKSYNTVLSKTQEKGDGNAMEVVIGRQDTATSISADYITMCTV